MVDEAKLERQLAGQKVIPVILGVDMNAYGVARSFHEKYGIISLTVGEGAFYHTKYSKIVLGRYGKNMQDEGVLIPQLKAVAEQYAGKTLFLLPTVEVYVEPVVNNLDELRKYYFVPSVRPDLLLDLVRKDRFQALCGKHGIANPATMVVTFDDYREKSKALPFGFPCVIKPNDSRTYFRVDFPGKKKAYVVDDAAEGERVIHTIYEQSEYRDELLVQEFIPGDDDGMRTIYAYSNQRGHLQSFTLTRTGVEDHLPELIGNPTVLFVETLTEPSERELATKIAELLDDLHYTGFANLDIKFDPRDGRFKVLDFNARLGRGSYVMTASGQSIAQLLVDDFMHGLQSETVYNTNDYLWSAVPMGIVKKYVRDQGLVNRAVRLAKEGKHARSLFYKKDMGLLRRLRLMKMDHDFYEDYRVNMPL